MKEITEQEHFQEIAEECHKFLYSAEQSNFINGLNESDKYDISFPWYIDNPVTRRYNELGNQLPLHNKMYYRVTIEYSMKQQIWIITNIKN